ncbi:hypothetical protein [Actinokineospora spheciospongiae]|uniref:hypothetical protein n=1 Tax=Actinokineospora spheciospongiae TaxID=909613 RepID=UPI0012683EC6|nr:hypothetical protein [Actinokineospora spheciospongiae]
MRTTNTTVRLLVGLTATAAAALGAAPATAAPAASAPAAAHTAPAGAASAASAGSGGTASAASAGPSGTASAGPGGAASAASAGAGTAVDGTRGRTVPVTAVPGDLLVQPSVGAGAVTFQVSTTDSKSGWVGLVKLHQGVTWESFRDTYRKLASTDPAAILDGSTRVQADATLLGGVQTKVGQPGTFVQVLAPGQYTLFDHMDFRYGVAQPRHEVLTVSGTPSGTTPTASGTLTAKDVPGEGPRFVVTGTPTVGQPLRFVNAMPGQANEAILFPLLPDVTDADLAAWVAKFTDHGVWPTDPPPFAEPEPAGLLPISPGQSVTATPPLHPGRYIAICWMKDADDAIMLLKKGMYEVFEVH